MIRDPRFRVPVLLVSALAVHLTVLPQVRIYGAAPDLMVLLAAAGGIACGPERGAGFGFLAGISIDVFLRTPMGLSALVFTLVGYSAGMVFSGVLAPTWYITLAAVCVASTAGVLLFAVLGAMLGEPLVGRRLLTVLGVVAVGNAILALPVVRATRWAVGDGTPTGPTLRRRDRDAWP